MSATKRTRLQLALPDVILQLPLSRSPLKDARTVLRNQSQQRTVLSQDMTGLDDLETAGDDDDDEILLSPRKKQRTKLSAKRPSSPFDDNVQSSKSGGGRDRKRPRRDSSPSLLLDDLNNVENNPHCERSVAPARTTATARKPISASATMRMTETRTTQGSRTPRSQSVPLSTTEHIPHIDFRILSPSPWSSPAKQKSPPLRIFNAVPFGSILLDTVQESRAENEMSQASEPSAGENGSTLRTQVEAVPDIQYIENDENMETDGSIAAQSIASFDVAAIETTFASSDFFADTTHLSTPKPFVPEPLLEMSPLTPLLETPLPHNSDSPSKDSISEAKVDCFDTRKTPIAEVHLPITNQVLPESLPTRADLAPIRPRSVTAPASSGHSKLPGPTKESSTLSSTSAGVKPLQATSLAKVLGPRTAAKISASSASTFRSSTSVEGHLKLAAVHKIAPAISRPPNEKLKARMKMREKPLTAFSFTKTKATSSGRVTRSVSQQKKTRHRSASVDERETFYVGMSGITTNTIPGLRSSSDLPLDVNPVSTDRRSEKPMSTGSPGKKSTLSTSEASTSHSNIRPLADASKGAIVSDIDATLVKPAANELIATQPNSPSKPNANPLAKQHSTSKSGSARPTVLATRRKSTLTSPTKASLARAASTVALHKPKSGPMPNILRSASSLSSLANLSNALEKLKVPHPVRPNSNFPPRPSTSMGFNRDVDEGGDVGMRRAVDDEVVGIDREETVGLDPGGPTSTSEDKMHGATPAIGAAGPETSMAVNKTAVRAKGQSTLAAWMSGGHSRAQGVGSHVGGGGNVRAKSRIFVAANRLGGNRPSTVPTFSTGIGRGTRKVSRNPGLPSVMASPAKDDGNDVETGPTDDGQDSRELNLTVEGSPCPDNGSSGNLFSTNIGGDGAETRDSRPNPWSKDAFRRASLASQALSQSLVEMHPDRNETVKGSMGPPPIGESGLAEGSSAGPASTRALRSSTRISTAIANSKGLAALSKDTDKRTGNNSSSSKARQNNAGKGITLNVLKNCTVFVDVRTDDGDDAGALFVQMLRDMGARILTRVGQTCTHIVYKNGLLSTLTRYRLMNDPKPKVVGIAWVVECVEQRQRVDEERFKVDLEGMNVAGVNKRRRSMLPKYIPAVSGDANSPDRRLDVSLSVTALDDLAPLEKARMRKGLLLASG